MEAAPLKSSARCSVKAQGRFRRPPRLDFDVTDCDFKRSARSDWILVRTSIDSAVISFMALFAPSPFLVQAGSQGLAPPKPPTER